MRRYTPPSPVEPEDWAAGLTGPDAGEKPGGGLTPRQMAFCRAMPRAATGAEAARIAGYAPENARQQASRLLRDPRVIQRIAVLRRAERPRPVPFLAPLMGQLEQICDRALSVGDHRAAIKAVEAQAQFLSRFGTEAAGDWMMDNIDTDALEDEAAALEAEVRDDPAADPNLTVWTAMSYYARQAAAGRKATAETATADAAATDPAATNGAAMDTAATGGAPTGGAPAPGAATGSVPTPEAATGGLDTGRPGAGGPAARGQRAADTGPPDVGLRADMRPTDDDESLRKPTQADRPTPTGLVAHAADAAAGPAASGSPERTGADAPDGGRRQRRFLAGAAAG